MSDKPARCPLCGSERTKLYPSTIGPNCIGECTDCGFTAIIRGDENNYREAWTRMGAWRNGGWRDIETAPRDGTCIYVAKLDDTFGWVRGISRWVDFKGISGWVSMGLYDPPGDLGLARPTHWLPLPEPPKEES